MTKRYFSIVALIVMFAAAGLSQGVDVTADSAVSENLFVGWNADDPERVEVIRWNPAGLDGSEPNLTRSGTLGTGPCFNGIAEYFGNSLAPPDPPSGKVLVGAGTIGTRVPGPDSKMIISSISNGCPAVSAEVAVDTIYKFWQGGKAANKMRVTRTFNFETPFARAFRPFVPRFYPISGFSHVLHPNAAGTMLLIRPVGGSACPFGCVVTDWDSSNEATSWFAVHNPITGQGIVVKHLPSASTAAIWVDWDAASQTNSSSVLLPTPAGGFTNEIVEKQTLCFYDSTTWIPSLTLPPGC
jgi:hypothetical protein